jgi:hypothetical protein
MYAATTWRRLEPRTRDEELTGTLAAELGDPLWLLGRQWQLGEFDGVDAGSPVSVDLTVDHAPVTAYGFGDEDGRHEAAYTDASPPLDVLAEREQVTQSFDDPDRNLRDAAEAGAQFLRLLAAEGLVYEASDFEGADALGSYPAVDSLLLDVPDDDLDAEGERFATVVSGRVLDGDRLHHVIEQAELGLSGPLPVPDAELGTEDGYTEGYMNAVRAFDDWYGEVYSEPGADAGANATSSNGETGSAGGTDPDVDAWNSDRLEYEFGVRVGEGIGSRGLGVESYEGGGLDWYDFEPRSDVPVPDVPDGASVPSTESTTVQTRPTPVTFGGMPARRWWAFEDGEVNVPNVDAGAEDLSRLLLAEYALVAGADWFHVPTSVPVGTMSTVDSLTVTDTFGRTTTVEHTVDAATSAGSDDAWSLFEYAFQAGNDVERSLFVPPTVADSIAGDPVEEVTFARDEGANVAWALEEAVEGPLGDRLDRHERSQQDAGDADDAPLQPTTNADWAYSLSTAVPDYWLPLVPVQRGTRTTDLELGEMLVRDRDYDPDPKGEILAARDMSIPDEEVPRTGKRVVRRYRRARWTNGETYCWSVREAGLGSGAVSSDLRFDVVAKRPPGDSGPLTVAVVSRQPAESTGAEQTAEYVAFRNDAGYTLDLTGWVVRDRADHEYRFPDGFELDAGDVVRLHTGDGTDDARDLYWGRDAAVWNNDVDAIHVFDDEGAVVTRQTYPDLTAIPEDSPVAVNVDHVDAAGDDYGNVEQEFVMLFNDGDEPLDLTGWRVEDLIGHVYEFPEGFVVDPGSGLFLSSGQGDDSEFVLYWGSETPIWNNDGDAMLVYDDRDVLVGGALI